MLPGARRLNAFWNSAPSMVTLPLFVENVTVCVEPLLLYTTETLLTLVYPPIPCNSETEYGLPPKQLSGGATRPVSPPPLVITCHPFKMSAICSLVNHGLLFPQVAPLRDLNHPL